MDSSPRRPLADLGMELPPSGIVERHPIVMGIINVTPDSFSERGRFQDPAAAVAYGRRLVEVGADILDIGGESTRPAGV